LRDAPHLLGRVFMNVLHPIGMALWMAFLMFWQFLWPLVAA
jgi:hypothetical protein